MLSDQGAWRLVIRGLELKFSALILFAAIPALATALWFYAVDPRWMLGLVCAAAAPDLIGRCLCFAAPIPNRLSIAISIVFQVAAFATLVGFAITGDLVQIGIGLTIAFGCQLASAFLFTRFLREAGEFLGDPAVCDGAELLGRRLFQSLTATWGLGLSVLIAAAVVFVLGMATCGIGFYVFGPVAVIVLVPGVLLTLAIVAAMYWAYGSAMVRLLTAIQNRRSLQQPIDAPLLDFAAVKGGDSAETVLASDGRYRLRLHGSRILLEDRWNPEVQTFLVAPGDERFSAAEVGPIEDHLQPDGYAYSREFLGGSIDAAADRVSVLFRVTVWESRYVPKHWEYSHVFIRRDEWSIPTGSFLESRIEESGPTCWQRNAEFHDDPAESPKS